MKQIVFVFLLAAAACGQRATAETQAAAYLRASFPAARSRTVTCMNQDTDGNGYVSCDSFIDGHAVALECAANAGCPFLCNEGCKLRPLVQLQGVGQ